MPIVPPDALPSELPFTPDERAIFHFGSGSGLRADPLGVERRYHDAMAVHDPAVVGQWLRRKSTNHRLLAFRRLVPVAHAALGTTPLDEATGAGLTGDEALATLDCFFAFRDRLTAATRAEAEIIATYGPVAVGVVTYRRYCGWYFNRERVQAIAGANHYHAAVAAARGPLHFALADAMAGSAAEARRIVEQFEADRAEAESRAQFRAP